MDKAKFMKFSMLSFGGPIMDGGGGKSWVGKSGAILPGQGDVIYLAFYPTNCTKVVNFSSTPYSYAHYK